MAEDDEFDANANVPLWINIVVPIALFIIFVLVLVWLFFTDKEVPAHVLERWLQKLRPVKKTNVDGETRDGVSIEQSQTLVKEVIDQMASGSQSFNIKPNNGTETIAETSKNDVYSASQYFKNYGAMD